MKHIKYGLRYAALAAIFTTTLITGSNQTQAKDNALEAVHDGVEAYVYGYPLVTMEMTRRIMTNVREPEGSRAPMGQFVRMRHYPNASYRDVTAPNADTLYTTAWIDVGKEPWVLSLPDAHDRYYLFPMLDGWTEVFQVPGKRTTGTGAQTYAITGPGWKGKLPAGVKEYKSPTSLVWLLGRVYCNGTPEDYAAVHKLQDEISLVPLSSYGKPYTPPSGTVDPSLDMKTAVREQVNALSATDYFNLLARLLKDNPPAAADKPIVAKMARLGIVPGQPFDEGKLEPLAKEAFTMVPKIANEKIMSWLKAGILAGDSKLEHGWLFTTKTGEYGVNYSNAPSSPPLVSGRIARRTRFIPLPKARTSSNPTTGAKKYVMHFPKGQLPPADGFWSLTMYDKDYFFVNNPLNRYSISARQNLKSNPDGSVDLYIQNASPGADKESNWLPAPPDKFILMMRLYWPKTTPPSLLDGTWKIPEVKAVE